MHKEGTDIDFKTYRDKVFFYRYEFYIRGSKKDLKGLEYRYRAQKETFDYYSERALQKHIMKDFTISLDLLQTKEDLCKQLEKFCSGVLSEASEVQNAESCSNKYVNVSIKDQRQFLQDPPNIYDFLKNKAGKKKNIENTFAEWEKYLFVYDRHQEGQKAKEIFVELKKQFDRPGKTLTAASEESADRIINECLRYARKLIESAENGTFPAIRE